MRAVGSIVGRFRIEELLFQNNTASVYRATDRANSTPVALKLVNVEACSDPRAQERLLAEGNVASLLNHPNIVQLLEVGEADGEAYISMELVTQPTLAQHLKSHGCLSTPRALKITLDTALALQYAHNLGVVHRDIKPGNIFLDDEGTPAKLADFGIAAAPHSAKFGRASVAQDSYATPRYMSPEQATGGSVYETSDQYSLGAVLFEMLTGQAPHDGPNLTTLMTQIANEPAPPLRSLKPQLPRSLEQLMQRLMQKKPQKRFADCKELIQTLVEAREQITGES
ncbi:MAG: serine/threonine-protein kinase [Halioglobus sp.]